MNVSIDLVFKIAAIGILVAVLNQCWCIPGGRIWPQWCP